MPRFFFNITDGQRVSADREGTEFSSLSAARQEGEETAREFLLTVAQNKDAVDATLLEIADDKGAVVGAIWFRDMVAH